MGGRCPQLQGGVQSVSLDPEKLSENHVVIARMKAGLRAVERELFLGAQDEGQSRGPLICPGMLEGGVGGVSKEWTCHL